MYPTYHHMRSQQDTELSSERLPNPSWVIFRKSLWCYFIYFFKIKNLRKMLSWTGYLITGIWCNCLLSLYLNNSIQSCFIILLCVLGLYQPEFNFYLEVLKAVLHRTNSVGSRVRSFSSKFQLCHLLTWYLGQLALSTLCSTDRIYTLGKIVLTSKLCHDNWIVYSKYLE